MATFSINLKDGSLVQPLEIIVGIDLGTTNSLVAYMKDGQPVCVKGADGKSTLVPSIVHFAENGQMVVGDAAKLKLLTDPANTIYSVKRLMGKSFKDVQELGDRLGYQILDDDAEALVKIRVKDRFYTPIELSSLILKELKNRVEAELNSVISKAVITVPAYFNDTQRQATRDAGRLAGLDVLRIVNEPTAAALAYGNPTPDPSPEGRGDVERSLEPSVVASTAPLPSGNPTPDPSPEGRGGVERSLEPSVVASTAPSTVSSTSPLPSGEGPGVGLPEGGGAVERSLVSSVAASTAPSTVSSTSPLPSGEGSGVGLPEGRGAVERSLVPSVAPSTPPSTVSSTSPLPSGEGAGVGLIAVYDLGGGTFDISILRIEDGIFEVLATNGDTFLGGDDFDRAIGDFFLQQLNIDPETVAMDAMLGQQIRLGAEAAKKALSSTEVFEQELNGQRVSITRAAFEALIQPLVQRTLDCCRNALRDAKLTTHQIEKVVMVGGSTRVPLVKQSVSELFGRPVFDQVNPDEIVALGAALQADVLAGNQQDILLLDVTPLSLGIETVGGLMDVIIPRNSKVPTKAGRQYTTSVDGQKNLKISVFQGERDLVEHNRKLGEFILRDLPPMPAGFPKIDIQFILNADGILTVRASELRSGLATSVEIRPTYGITEEEMGKMLLESIQNAQTDMKARGLLEARNEANNLLLSGQKFLQQNDDILSTEEKAGTNALLSALRATTLLEDKDAIHRAIEALNTYTMPLAHRAMDTTLRAAMTGKKI